MNWPWIARSSHLALLEEREQRLCDRDRRIADLENERRLLWDTLSRLGWGASVFQQPASVKLEAAVPTMASKSPAKPPPPPPPRRPSQVVARLTQEAFQRWRRKSHPGVEERRELTMQELDRAEMDVITEKRSR